MTISQTLLVGNVVLLSPMLTVAGRYPSTLCHLILKLHWNTFPELGNKTETIPLSVNKLTKGGHRIWHLGHSLYKVWWFLVCIVPSCWPDFPRRTLFYALMLYDHSAERWESAFPWTWKLFCTWWHLSCRYYLWAGWKGISDNLIRADNFCYSLPCRLISMELSHSMDWACCVLQNFIPPFLKKML